jgi:Mg-chelatase subunit ChlD
MNLGVTHRGRLQVRALALVLGVALLGAGFVQTPRAESASVLDIVSVQHDPRGALVAALRPTDADAEVTEVSVLIDGAPRAGALVARRPQDEAIVIAIDTSGSMAGTPMEQARTAAVTLVERLAPEHQVAIVAFSDRPEVVSPFSLDRRETIAQLRRLTAKGNTALYDAITVSADLLATRGGQPSAVVLLSDGEDHGSQMAGGRETSGDRMAASGAPLHAFALGPAADASYLADVAGRTRGGYWAVTDSGALNDLFARLGDRLGAPLRVEVQVPPLTRGEHSVEIRARVDGEAVTVKASATVTNDGLLVGRVRRGERASDGVVLDLSSVAPSTALEIRARAGEHMLPVLAAPPRVLVDPWQFAPGDLNVEVSASIAGTVISTTTLVLTVETLAPRIDVRTERSTNGDTLIATGQVQGGRAFLSARAGGRLVADGPLPELRVSASESDDIQFALIDESGVEIANAGVPTAVGQAADGRSLGAPMVLAMGLAILGVMIATGRWQVARWPRRRTDDAWQPSGRAFLVGRRGPPPTVLSTPMGTLVVRPPDGAEQRYPIGRKPLSVGHSPECDVVIDDAAVGAVHARVIALSDGDFQLHGIAPRRGMPSADRGDEWMIVRDGEQIAVGTYLLTLLSTKAVPNA